MKKEEFVFNKRTLNNRRRKMRKEKQRDCLATTVSKREKASQVNITVNNPIKTHLSPESCVILLVRRDSDFVSNFFLSTLVEIMTYKN